VTAALASGRPQKQRQRQRRQQQQLVLLAALRQHAVTAPAAPLAAAALPGCRVCLFCVHSQEHLQMATTPPASAAAAAVTATQPPLLRRMRLMRLRPSQQQRRLPATPLPWHPQCWLLPPPPQAAAPTQTQRQATPR
jgi:hypothetical protein